MIMNFECDALYEIIYQVFYDSGFMHELRITFPLKTLQGIRRKTTSMELYAVLHKTMHVIVLSEKSCKAIFVQSAEKFQTPALIRERKLKPNVTL